MGKLVYSVMMSLDGFIEDRDGNFDWAEPDEEVHQFANDRTRGASTHLYGRRMYETMAPWETEPSLAESGPVMRDFAEVWQAADKVVYSTTLERPLTERTRIERAFDAEAVRRLKAEAAGDVVIGGPGLAAHAFRFGLVDEVELFVIPVAVGGGKRALPVEAQLQLELLEERRFANGTLYVRYGTRS